MPRPGDACVTPTFEPFEQSTKRWYISLVMQYPVDGLTPRALQASRKSWWDDRFTRLLLDFIPLQTRKIIEIDCGLAAAAHVLLPSLPRAMYLGVDFNPERLAEARGEVEGTRLAQRVELRLVPPTNLPLEDAGCDVVLSIMSLQHRPDVPEVLTEASRVLEPRGRMVAVEPDNLGQHFYFDGVLEEVNTVFHALCLRARVAKQPADIALGPRLPSLVRMAGLQRIKLVTHMVHSARMESAVDFCNRLGRIVRAIAHEADLDPDDPLIGDCDQAIKRCLFAGLPRRLGFSCHFVPVFLCAGRKV